MPETPLTILHVSDLHERGPREKDTWRRRRVLGDAWEKNLDEIRAEGPLDLVCFTGDAAFSGKADEYARVTEFFHAMLERLGLGWDRFFLVPGNHDIDRTIEKAAWKRLRKNLPRANRSEVARWLTGGGAPLGFQDREREQVFARQADYREWVKAGLGLPHLDPGASPHGHLGYRKTLRLPGHPFDLHILGLDSAWMCGDDNDAGKLWLTDDQVMRLATLATEDGRPLEGFRLCLVHHPLDELADGGDCRRLLANHVDLVLRGHLHDPEPQTWEDPERALAQVAAGCLYEHDTYPNACECIRITLDEKGRPLGYDLWFRGWAKRGHWCNDNRLYRDTVDGRLRWKRDRGPVAETTPRAGRLFVGREPELEELEKNLLGEGEARPVAICAVQGMPGVGKSYLAERFVYLHRGRFPGGVYPLVLDPESAVSPTVEVLLGELADRLKLSPAPAGLADRVRARLLHPRSLLEVENVDSEGLAGTVAGLIDALHGCPALVTGRYQGLGESAGWGQVQVRPFDEGTALAQLAEELGDQSSREEEGAYHLLVRTLGFLPLAVHLAAGHLRAGRSVRGFLDLLRKTGWTLSPADPADPLLTGKKTRALLASTFSLSLDLLRSQLGTEGDRLLAGFCDLGHAPASGFGSSLGAAMAGLADLDFEELTVAACRLSLLDSIPPAERRDRAFRVHPLLAEVLRGRSGEEGRRRTVGRMTDWFVSRLPRLPFGEEEEQGKLWREVQAETEALTAWLPLVPEGDAVRVERAAAWFAMLNGPFHAWSAFCEQLLTYSLEAVERSDVLWTLGKVAFRSGDLDRAAFAAQEQGKVDKGRGAERDAALAAGLLADILQARGDLEEALRIRRKELLPVFERLGDVRSRAVTMGQIADVLQARGELEEALRIRREEELLVYERLGDVRSRALTMGKIADVLQARGELEEALRIRREEELPVYERLGDVRSRAVTMGQIADVLQARGELEEALRIRREEELPVYERLGDLRERAVTMGKIADVLQARGELEEALRIRREEQLPVYERLGDVRERALTMGKIADVLQARGELEEALRIRREEELPVYERLGDVRSRGVTMGKIADVLQARGDLEEALRIYREEQLPVLERLGDVRGLLVCRTNLALTYLKRNQPGDRETAADLLYLALQAAEAMRIPEAEQIRSILQREGLAHSEASPT